MSLFSDVCDAWMTNLITLSGLTAVPAERRHKYTPWSVESTAAAVGERHIAIWPTGDPEVAEPLTADGSLLGAQAYTVLIWENIGSDTARRVDDETAAASWLTLYETVRTSMLTRTNWQLGSSTIMPHCPYVGGSLDRVGDSRVMSLNMKLVVPLSAI